MKRFLLAFLLSLSSVAASASILTFDNNGPTQNAHGKLGNYQGFKFSSNLEWIDLVNSPWNYGAISGDFGMKNQQGGVGIITKIGNADFSFDGLYAETWANASARSATIFGFNNGTLLWSETKVINGNGYTKFDGMGPKIDELHIAMGDYFLIDNVAMNHREPAPAPAPAPAVVPEPASLALLGLALAGLAGARRRKQA